MGLRRRNNANHVKSGTTCDDALQSIKVDIDDGIAPDEAMKELASATTPSYVTRPTKALCKLSKSKRFDDDNLNSL
jgi:glutamyl-tRNA reductase